MAQVLSIAKSPSQLAKMADQYKALGDPTRLEIMMAVSNGENSEACVCDLTPQTGLAQSTVSHHLKILVDAGLLIRTQRGKWAFFELTSDAKRLLK
jgi:ArsR family transcriptional regulator